MMKRVCVLALSLAAPALAQAPHDPARLFPHEAPVVTNAEQGTLVRLALPADVLERARPDLSDVRVHDDRGQDVPYLVDSGARPWPRDAALPSYAVTPIELARRVEDGDSLLVHWVEVVSVAPPGPAPDGARWTISIDSARDRFVKSIAVFAVDGGARTEIARGGVFRLQDPARERLAIELPSFAVAPASLEIELRGEGGYVEPTVRFTATRAQVAPATLELPLEEVARERNADSTWITLARPSGVAPDRLRVRTSTAHFHRVVRVVDVVQGQGETEIGRGQIFRAPEVEGAEVIEIALRPARGERIRVEMLDGDSPALAELELEAIVRQPTIVFESRGGEVTLRFGGGRARAPQYDVQRFLGSMLGETMLGQTTDATLGPVRENPSFDGGPALGFAMRAGRTPELARYTHVAPLEIEGAREGLTRVRLSPTVLAAARADLADVRIVDEQGRQWPYLRDPHDEIEIVEARVSAPETSGRFSTYAIRLPVSRARLATVYVHTSAPYLSRAFTLHGIDDDGRRVSMGRGVLHRDPGDTAPLEITTSTTRISSLELEIEDGSDAPLEIESIELAIPSPSLFLAAPDGAYRVLAGDEEAAAPEYEIVRASALVLAVRAADARAGRASANAAHVEPPWYEAASFETWIVWGVLLLAVFVLGLLTLRLAGRSEEPAAPTATEPSSAPPEPAPPESAPPTEPPKDDGSSTKPVSF